MAERGRRTALALALAAAGLLATVAAAGPQAQGHWPLPPPELEPLLAAGTFEIRDSRGGVGGVMGVRKLHVSFPETGLETFLKWKPAPVGDADGWNNAPRKEIAAYEIQKWFLDPDDYVVPTTVLRCIPLADYAPTGLEPIATLRDTSCAVGTLVVWLDQVTVPDVLYDVERFRSDPLYARRLADFNLLTYLIDHEDGRRGNFLVSEDDSDRRVFSIDNGVAFGAKVKNIFVHNWNRIRVAGLRAQSVERLRRVGDDRLRALAALVELRADAGGVLRAVPPGANPAPDLGARVAPGWLQLGLTTGEIAALRRRRELVLADVDAGRIPLLPEGGDPHAEGEP
jgi:hypothetical protein